jgi:hypothetical protein
MYQTPAISRTLKELLVPIDIIRFVLQSTNSIEQQAKLPPSPTIVIPGLGSSDISTKALRRYLSSVGLTVYKGGIGRNNGDLKTMIPMADNYLQEIWEKHQKPVVVIGWSLGGIIARELARNNPNKVAAVCCLGTPIFGGGRYSAYAPIYKKKGIDMQQMEDVCNRREIDPISVPSLSLYSKKDGIVWWNASIDVFNPHTQNTEVKCRHFSMGFSVEVCQIISAWLQEVSLGK